MFSRLKVNNQTENQIWEIEKLRSKLLKDSVKELDEKKLSSLIKLSGTNREELKEAFGSAGKIRLGYFELQREICR